MSVIDSIGLWLYSSECISIDPSALQILTKFISDRSNGDNRKLPEIGTTVKYEVPPVSRIMQSCSLVSVKKDDDYLTQSEIDQLLWSSMQASEVHLREFIKLKIYPVFLYTFWCEHSNVVSYSRPLFGRNCSFPWGVVLPTLYSKYKKRELLNLIGETDLINSNAKLEVKILHDLKIALDVLSGHLKSKKFLLGDHLSSIDGYLFGLLFPLVKAGLPWKKAQTSIQCFDSVINYVERIETLIREQLKVSGFKEPRKLSIVSLMERDKVKTIATNSVVIVASVCAIISYTHWCKILKFRQIYFRFK